MRKPSHFTVALVVCLLLVFSAGTHAAQAQQEHRLVLHVDRDDTLAMNMALGNAMNAKKYFDTKGENLTVEIVAYGPGIKMLRDDTSPVKDAIARTKKNFPGLALSMCGNAKAHFEEIEGHEITPLPGVTVVPAGIARIMELEEQGYSYVRP